MVSSVGCLPLLPLVKYLWLYFIILYCCVVLWTFPPSGVFSAMGLHLYFYLNSLNSLFLGDGPYILSLMISKHKDDLSCFFPRTFSLSFHPHKFSFKGEDSVKIGVPLNSAFGHVTAFPPQILKKHCFLNEQVILRYKAVPGNAPAGWSH